MDWHLHVSIYLTIRHYKRLVFVTCIHQGEDDEMALCQRIMYNIINGSSSTISRVIGFQFGYCYTYSLCWISRYIDATSKKLFQPSYWHFYICGIESSVRKIIFHEGAREDPIWWFGYADGYMTITTKIDCQLDQKVHEENLLWTAALDEEHVGRWQQ